jgi:hypothetical protein
MQRGLRVLGVALFLTWFIGTLWYFDFSPTRLWNGLGGLGKIIVLMIPPSPGELWVEILKGLAESVAMAVLGTFLAALVAIPLGFMGARNVVTVTLLRFSFRRVLDGMRGVDQLIWALAFVRAVGLGPLAGVLAIFVSDIAILSKLYAEVSRPPVVDGCLASASGCCRRWPPSCWPRRSISLKAIRVPLPSLAWWARAGSGCKSPSAFACAIGMKWPSSSS